MDTIAAETAPPIPTYATFEETTALRPAVCNPNMWSYQTRSHPVTRRSLWIATYRIKGEHLATVVEDDNGWHHVYTVAQPEPVDRPYIYLGNAQRAAERIVKEWRAARAAEEESA